MSEMTPDEFWSILHAAPEPKPVLFRLYYNDDGTPVCYSMDELPHAYVDIEPEVFHQNNLNVRVVDGKLIFKRPKTVIKKLRPADNGTACDPRDVCVVVAADQPNQKWTIANNEID